MSLEFPSSTTKVQIDPLPEASVAGKEANPVGVSVPSPTLAHKGVDSAGISLARLAPVSKPIEEVVENIRTQLKGLNHKPNSLGDFEKVYANSNFSDDLFPLIAEFIDTPGIDSQIFTLSKESGDAVSGAAGELYHAKQLKDKGYRIVSFGLSLKTKSDGLETDLIVERDGKYYMAEVKHFPGRRWYDKEKENKFADTKSWTEKHFLDVKNGSSGKLDNYKVILPLIVEKPLNEIEEQIGPEASKLTEQISANGNIPILFSYAETAAISITKDGQKIIPNESNEAIDIGGVGLNELAQANLTELDRVDQILKEYGQRYGFEITTERSPFVLFNRTNRVSGGNKVTVNRKIEQVKPVVVEEAPKSEFTQAKLDALIGKLTSLKLQDSSLQIVRDTLSKILGQSHNAESLAGVIKPLGAQLKKDMTVVKKAVSEI